MTGVAAVVAVTGTQKGSAGVANTFVFDGLPFSPTVLTPGTNPMRSGFDGPRFEAPPTVMPPVAAEVTAADGRPWK